MKINTLSFVSIFIIKNTWLIIVFAYFQKSCLTQKCKKDLWQIQANSSRNRLSIALCEDVNEFAKEVTQVPKESKIWRKLVVRRTLTKKCTWAIMDILNTYVQGNYVKKNIVLCKDQRWYKRPYKTKVGSRVDVTYGKAEREKYDKCKP